MTALPATTERIIEAVLRFPDHIQKQFLIDRMDMYLGHGMIPQTGDIPFRIVHMDIPEEAEELLQFKIEGLKRSKTVSQIFWMINKPDRLQLLNFLNGVYVFDPVEYTQILREIWISTEFPHQMSNKSLVNMFKCADTQFLMTDDEIEALGSMENEFTVFRGLQDTKTRHKALSWTIKYEIAHWFANRWNKALGTPQIIKAQIEKKHVFAYINARNEEEIILNPNHLKKMEIMGVL
jgi:hypothetical protein